MKTILIISVTAGNNFTLAEKIKRLMHLDNEIITLEDYQLPLYDGKVVIEDKTKIHDLCKKVESADGFIFCGPEYNGGSAPILTNAITWISVTTNHWRDAFLDKIGLIATHSGGDGSCFLATFRQQLEFMGVVVFPRTIKVNKNHEFKKESIKKIVERFEKLFESINY